MVISDEYATHGYVIMRNVLSPELRLFAKEYMDMSYRSGRMSKSSHPLVFGQHEEYAAVFSETLLARLRPFVEESIRDDVVPTYSFWRIYQRGAKLGKHVDREACEVSMSINLAAEPDDACWPLLMHDLAGRQISVSLDPGDGVLYMGCKVPHWRTAFEGDRQYQVFLHYVRAAGKYAGYKYDGRAGIAMPKSE